MGFTSALLANLTPPSEAAEISELTLFIFLKETPNYEFSWSDSHVLPLDPQKTINL